MGMNGKIVGFLALMILASSPAAAMTADSLDIRLDGAGRADIQFNYSLSWFEHVAVYLRIVDPANELKSALESDFQKPVQVRSVDSGSVSLSVEQFAYISRQNGYTRMRTPKLSFTAGKKILERYWFAPLIAVDFSPSVTTIRFPDGYTITFMDALEIPAQEHVLSP